MKALGEIIEDLRWKAPIFWRKSVQQRGGKHFELRWAPYDDLTAQLAAHGVEIRSHQIDIKAFWRYVESCKYRELSYWGGGEVPTAPEKWLEHWVSIELLDPQPGEVSIDIASCYSPFPDLLREHYGVESYRQDIIYPAGLDGDKIGGDAIAMPIADNFADHLTLHCSFEHFEGDRDTLLLKEAQRVLRPGGRLCILPFYTSHAYCIQSDPGTWKERNVRFEDDALIYLARNWQELHARMYDTAHFLERIVARLEQLDLAFYTVANYAEVDPICYLKFAALFTKRGT